MKTNPIEVNISSTSNSTTLLLYTKTSNEIQILDETVNYSNGLSLALLLLENLSRIRNTVPDLHSLVLGRWCVYYRMFAAVSKE